ncbi:MAG: DUF2461 domain-containing protein [Calditrichaeota bacterium]|nr:DUF2461 domain-containing protein [Calditrichota bacterium]MCB9366033.1 DUF2461 domain-containing protein [Calditrichota bacterium]MCB9391841.1 DUF2461 domain-containing protein [Calditrichota bacterium]
MPAYFDDRFLKFFRALTKNNSTEWFRDHKDEYESVVKEPALHFAADLISKAQKDDPRILISPNEAMLRINRDIRFAREKHPYNTHVRLIVSRAGRADKGVPGMYVKLGADGLGLYGGVHCPDPKPRDLARAAIAKDPRGFKKLITAAPFKKHFGGLMSDEVSKRLPVELQDAAEICPEIANKSFHYGVELPANEITSPKLLQTAYAHWKAAFSVNQFLLAAFDK